jgi:hypothetical protein
VTWRRKTTEERLTAALVRTLERDLRPGILPANRAVAAVSISWDAMTEVIDVQLRIVRGAA